MEPIKEALSVATKRGTKGREGEEVEEKEGEEEVGVNVGEEEEEGKDWLWWGEKWSE